MDVVVPKKMDTGTLKKQDTVPMECRLDFAEGKICKVHRNEVVELHWSKWKSPKRQTGTFIYNLKAWVTPKGNRKVTLRARRIREDGQIGMEILVWKRVNGRFI